MFSNTIEFLAPEIVLDDKVAHPLPIKKLTPDWYKKLTADKDTVKNCMPFLDTLTTGYALPLTAELVVKFNHIETDDTIVRCPHEIDQRFAIENELNVAINPSEAVHPRWQLEGSPLLSKNRNQTVQKILWPWTIKTPPGYSCLFVPPMNNRDDRFEIIPGIVDTDSYPLEINFPFVLNGDKYQRLDTKIKKGTIFAQCIPFKRESWKMKIGTIKKLHKVKENWKYKFLTKFQQKYKVQSWTKKNFY